MALLSVKRFLTQLEEEAAYRRVISMLLEAVAIHALNLDCDAYRSFGERIGEIRRALASETAVEALLSDAGSAVQTIADYARETTRLMHTRNAEIENTIALLGGSAGQALAAAELAGNGLERSAAVESDTTQKERANERPAGKRDEGRQSKSAPDPTAGTLPDVPRKQAGAYSLGLDPVTGLPCEGAAQAQFLSVVRTGEQKHVAVFVLGSAQRINLRFGRAAGDQVIQALKQYLASRLESSDRMFRWPGPAIVALLASTEPIERVRGRLKRFLEKPIERTFDINGRSVLIPLSIAWSVYGLSLPLAVPNRQIHDFIAGQGYREEDPMSA